MNYFDQVADRQLNGAQKAKERRQQRTAERREERLRPPTAMEIKRQEQAILAKMYSQWRRGIRDELARAHGRDFAALIRIIRNLDWRDAPKVVEFVRNAQWLRDADEDTKFETARFIDGSFCRSRVRAGKAPLDDGIFDEPPGPFMEIRWILFGY